MSSQQTDSSLNTTTKFSVRYIDHGQSRLWNKIIYDVDGNPVIGDNGTPISFFHGELKDMFSSKRVTLHHRLKEPSYRYIVTSTNQLRTFLDERQNGADTPKTYHVYVDEDSDRTCQEYKNMFSRCIPQYTKYKSD